MEQRKDSKTVSVEKSIKRINAIQTIFMAILLSVPLIGLFIGCYFALTTVLMVIARSKRMVRDMFIAALTIALGFIGMLAAFVALLQGHAYLGYAGDLAINYFILTVMLGKCLGHVFAMPQPEEEPEAQTQKQPQTST